MSVPERQNGNWEKVEQELELSDTVSLKQNKAQNTFSLTIICCVLKKTDPVISYITNIYVGTVVYLN